MSMKTKKPPRKKDPALGQDIVDAFNEFIRDRLYPCFATRAPLKLTYKRQVHLGSPPYLKLSVNGGAPLVLTGAYIGKRAGVIFTFHMDDASFGRPAGDGSAEYEQIEIAEADARLNLEGFKAFLDSYLLGEFDRAEADVASPGDSEEPRRSDEEIVAALLENPDYGAFS